jgi:hypothetical protein
VFDGGNGRASANGKKKKKHKKGKGNAAGRYATVRGISGRVKRTESHVLIKKDPY